LLGSPEYEGPKKPVRATTPCIVAKVTDGDSIVCAHLGRVRLLGIDAPELSQKPYGKQSQGALAAMIPVGSTVQLEQDVQAQDRNGRPAGVRVANGRLVNWEMVRGGWVVTLTYAPNVQYVDALRKAAKEAEQEELGLWATDGFACLPVERRRGSC
jgi:micrococcal nuclease